MATISDERGLTLVEVLIALAIAALLVVICVTRLGHNPYERHSARSSFASALDRAHALAQSSGNGATLIKFPNIAAGITVPGYFFVLCSGRPILGKNFNRCARLDAQQGDITVPATGSETWALYVDSRGSVAAGPWPSSYSQTMAGAPQSIASEPVCPSGTMIAMQISGGEAATTQSVDCDTGTLQ